MANNVYVFAQQIANVGTSDFENNGEWHFCFCSDGTVAGTIFYANGEPRGSTEGSTLTGFASGSKNFHIMNWIGGTNWEFDGQFLELRYYHNRVFSIQEVYEDYMTPLRPFRKKALSLSTVDAGAPFDRFDAAIVQEVASGGMVGGRVI